jgi:hypothetical protein
VLDADIRDFFSAIDDGWPVSLVEHRISDKSKAAVSPAPRESTT